MKKDIKKMTRGEVISLFSLIRNIKSAELSKEALIKYVLLRIKLKAVFDEYERAREEISAQTKPDGWKEGDDVTAWDAAFSSIMKKWLAESVDFDTKVLSQEECIDLIASNPHESGVVGDAVMGLLSI